MEEVWLSVPGYAGFYKASNLGRIKRVARDGGERFLRPVKTGNYWYVSLSLNGEVKSYKLHVLILRSFCGDRPFDGAHAAHNDGNPDNNFLSNLRWASPKENQADVDRHGNRCRGSDVHCAVLAEDDVRQIRRLIASGVRNKPIAENFGVSVSTIHLIRHNKIWRHVDDQ